VAQSEWRLLPLLNLLADETAYKLFVALHVPIVVALVLPIMNKKFAKNPAIGITDSDLAKAMVKAGLEATEESKIFSNQMIREAAASG